MTPSQPSGASIRSPAAKVPLSEFPMAGEKKIMPTFDGEPDADPDQDLPESSQQPLDLVPGFRDRLLMELDAAGVPARRRIAELCRITGRASPTVRRWVDPEQPGLPDLESFARLCQSL